MANSKAKDPEAKMNPKNKKKTKECTTESAGDKEVGRGQLL